MCLSVVRLVPAGEPDRTVVKPNNILRPGTLNADGTVTNPSYRPVNVFTARRQAGHGVRRDRRNLRATGRHERPNLKQKYAAANNPTFLLTVGGLTALLLAAAERPIAI